MENKELVFTAENSMWNMELLREAALRGDIRCMREDGSFIEDREEIKEYFGELEEKIGEAWVSKKHWTEHKGIV